jgi:hypothetical protein
VGKGEGKERDGRRYKAGWRCCGGSSTVPSAEKKEANKDDDDMAGQVSNGADKAGFSVEGKVAIVTGAGSG